jgi:quercetin dioxygenase-like cupin family protein
MERSERDFVLVRAGEMKRFEPEAGMVRRIGGANEKLTLVEHRLAGGWVGARHSHPHDQLTYVVSGCLRMTVGAETFDMRPGDSLVMRGGVEHQGAAPEGETVVLDVFTPCREEYV